ncbi:MAG: hypothetical protein ACQESC_02360 [Nanobdellota archaeon]
MVLGFHKDFWKQFSFKIEETILFLIIILNILDGFEILPADFDFIKKIISWSALGYILYKGSPTTILFGTKKQRLDSIIIIGYFLFTLKNIVSYMISTIGEVSSFLKPLYHVITTNAILIERAGIFIGLFLLLLVAIRFSLKIRFKKPSVIHLIHGDKLYAKHPGESLLRIATSFLVLMSFFVIVFNLFMEWLAIAIDAPLVIIALAIYFFFILKHRHSFLPGSFLHRFGNFGEQFYTSFLRHLRYRSSVLKILSGMIVLHVLTDAFNFLWPFIIGRSDALYFSVISTPHPILSELFLQDMGSTLTSKLLAGVLYIGNITAVFFLLLSPVLLWFLLYKNTTIHVRTVEIGVILFSLFSFALFPLFSFTSLYDQGVFGVDIIGQSLYTGAEHISPILIVLIIFVLASIFSGLFSHHFKQTMIKVLVMGSLCFLLYYIILYFLSIHSFYTRTLAYLWGSGDIILSLFFGLLYLITTLFYITGITGFFIDSYKHLISHFH